MKEFSHNLCGVLQVKVELLAFAASQSIRMKLLLVAAAVLAAASCTSLPLEDLEFHAWKLNYGEAVDTLARPFSFVMGDVGCLYKTISTDFYET